MQIQDAGGNPVAQTGSTRTVNLTTGSGGGSFRDSGDTTTITSVTIAVGVNSASFLYKDTVAGTPTITAATTSPTTLTSGTQGETVSAAAASKLAFTTSPGGTLTGGTAFGTQPVVTVQDQFGNTVTGSSASIALAITTGTPTSGGPGALSGTTSVPASSGVATFSGLSINTVGTAYKLTASSSGLASADSTAFNITAGAAAKLGITTSPQTLTAGVSSGDDHRANSGCWR